MTTPSVSNSGMVVCYTAIFLLSLNGLFAKYIALDAITITHIRSVIAALALITFCLFTKRSLVLNNKRETFFIYALGLLMGLHWATYFHAMQVSTIAIGMLALFTYPVFTVLFEPFFHKQGIKFTDLLAVLCVAFGLLLICYDGVQNAQGNIVAGVSWGVLSALLFTVRNLLQKYHLPNVDSNHLMLHQLIMIACMFLLFIDLPAVMQATFSDVIGLLLLGVFTTAMAHTLLTMAFKTLSVKTVSLLSCIQPVIGAVLAWWLLNEVITVPILFGGIIILSVAIYETKKQARPVKAE